MTGPVVDGPVADGAREGTATRRRAWSFVPSLYFAEGLPYVIVNSLSVVMYKRLGASNEWIGLTSLFYLPWVVKMFWGPLVDLVATKRAWILATQATMSVLFAALALALHHPAFLALSAGLLVLVAFASATHDIAVDGYYMIALNPRDEAFFTGIRSTFYRLAMLFGSGALVVLAGRWEVARNDVASAWSATFGIAALLFLSLAAFHLAILPHPERRAPPPGTHRAAGAPPGRRFVEIFAAYFRQPRVGALLFFILTYRLGEAFLTKMTAPFLLDPPADGGLGLSTETVGYVYGTLGVASLVAGGIVGGWVIARFGLRSTIWPLALALKAPDVVYVYMAIAHPPVGWVYPLVALEQFGYGLGFTAFTVVLMYSATGEYKTSHFAISTGLMALGMMGAGVLSGFAQAAFGYLEFFLLVLVLTIPGLLAIFLLPLAELEAAEEARVR